MREALDLTGRRFGRLVARSVEPDSPRSGRRKWRMRRWLCDCDCGTGGLPVKTNRLTSGNTRSCGCARREKARSNCKKLGGARSGRAECPRCGAEFSPTIHQIYCSRACNELSRKARRRRDLCVGCGVDIPDARSNQWYCSHACRRKNSRVDRPSLAMQFDILTLKLMGGGDDA